MNDLEVTDHDNRGFDGNRINFQEKDKIGAHIDKFSQIESHYVRKDSKREYLKVVFHWGKCFTCI